MLFKIIVEIGENNDFSDFYKGLSGIGDVLYYNEEFFVHLFQNESEQNLKVFLENCEVSQFFIKEINGENLKNFDGYVGKWLKERSEEDKVFDLEKNHQDLLQKAHNNITKVIETLKK